MNKIVAFALPFAIAAVSPAFAQTAAAPMPPQAVSSAGSEARIVPVEGSQDGDVGLEGYAAVDCSPVYSGNVSSVGPVFGDDEKDTVAHTVVGTDCR